MVFRFATSCIATFVLSLCSAATIVEGVLSGGSLAEFGSNVEAYGSNMSVAFPGLPQGQYTVEVEAAELYFNSPGMRVMDISCDGISIAKDLDLSKSAGGKNKPVNVSAKVNHRADSLGGALTVVFAGKVENAKFDLIRIKNASGAIVGESVPAKLQNKQDAEISRIPKVAGPEIWKDPTKKPEARADDLIRRLSTKEKISQIMMAAPAILRLGIPAYDWWNESLHGVARAGHATVFPQAIAAAATWNDDLWNQAANAISDEARAKHHEYARTHNGDSARYYGLDMWSPNVNIFRDPRWGRGHETYGEDPYLTSRFGVTFVKGLQGDDPKYLKTVATPKHYAVHSGPEHLRHVFDAQASEQDLFETYLPAFEACIREGKAYSIMTAYNRFRGQSCTAHDLLMLKLLRGVWGFNGYTVSDVDSVDDIWRTHKLVRDAAEAAAIALKKGLDLNSGGTYSALPEALRRKLCSVKDIDIALKRCLVARFRLGMFDPPQLVKYAKIPFSKNDSLEHDALALKVAQEAIVLLKNERKALPLAKSGTIAVIGPTAAEGKTDNAWINTVLTGNYAGLPSHPVPILDGIAKKLEGKGTVLYAKGCDLMAAKPELEKEALEAARKADRIIAVMGLSPQCEGEEGDGGERTSLALLPHQEDLLKRLCALGKPVTLVLTGGSAIAANWAKENVPAILDCWYPGQRGGDAVADVLFGDYNPAGRLPVTFYKSEKDLPAFEDYGMKGRTYRYFPGEPLWGFGYGLSYTTFAYSGMKVVPAHNGEQTVSVSVKNTSELAGDEVVQLYISQKGSGLPIRSLRGFKRIHLRPGETKTVAFHLTPFQFAFANTKGIRTVEVGEVEIGVGGSQIAAQSATVKIEKRIANPPYMHKPPSVR